MNSLRKSRHKFYTKANKPDTIFALVLRKVDQTLKPVRLKLSRDTYSSNPLKMLHKFSHRLTNLYTILGTFNQTNAENLFSRIKLPTISAPKNENLNKPITTSEVITAIKILKTNKRPGPMVYQPHTVL